MSLCRRNNKEPHASRTDAARHAACVLIVLYQRLNGIPSVAWTLMSSSSQVRPAATTKYQL